MTCSRIVSASHKALRGVPFVGETVIDGNAGVSGQFFDDRLRAAAVLDGVIHPSQHSRGVRDGLLVPHLAASGIQVCGVRALVGSRNFESASSPGGRLLKDEGNALASQPMGLAADVLLGFELRRLVEQALPLAWCEVQLLEKCSSGEL